MRTRREMFHIAAAISIVIMLAISPIMIGKAYSVEYTGQVSNIGNNVQSEYITLTLLTKNGNNYTPVTNEVLKSQTLNYVEVTEVIEDKTVTKRYLDGTYPIIKDSSNIHVRLSGPEGYVLNEYQSLKILFSYQINGISRYFTFFL